MCLLAAMLFVNLFSLPAVGGIPTVVLVLIWLALLLVGLYFFIRRPWLTAVAAVLDLAAWIVFVLMR